MLSDGTQRLELIDVGPNPHAKEMVIAYLPKQVIPRDGFVVRCVEELCKCCITKAIGLVSFC